MCGVCVRVFRMQCFFACVRACALFCLCRDEVNGRKHIHLIEQWVLACVCMLQKYLLCLRVCVQRLLCKLACKYLCVCMRVMLIYA